MKRISVIAWFMVMLLILTSCYTTKEYDSLDEYRQCIINNKYTTGHSSLGLDDPDNLLPYSTFIEEYPYIEGEYHLYEDDPIKTYTPPSTCILWLKYTPDIYAEVQKNIHDIINYAGDDYCYNDFVFLIHKNLREASVFTPDWFTMIGYNDKTCTIFFLGFHHEDMSVEDVSNLMEHNFGTFLNTYWGKHFHFE